MPKYHYATDIIEWVIAEPAPILPDIRVLVPGRLNGVRRWLFNKLSKPWVQKSRKMKHVSLKRDRVTHLLAQAANRQHYRLDHIENFIISPETAFEIEDELLATSLTFGVQLCSDSRQSRMLQLFDIPVIVLNTYMHDEILIIPKEKYR